MGYRYLERSHRKPQFSAVSENQCPANTYLSIREFWRLLIWWFNHEHHHFVWDLIRRTMRVEIQITTDGGMKTVIWLRWNWSLHDAAVHYTSPHLVGGWATPLKNISQLGWLFPIYGQIKHVPNHQPVIYWYEEKPKAIGLEFLLISWRCLKCLRFKTMVPEWILKQMVNWIFILSNLWNTMYRWYTIYHRISQYIKIWVYLKTTGINSDVYD